MKVPSDVCLSDAETAGFESIFKRALKSPTMLEEVCVDHSVWFLKSELIICLGLDIDVVNSENVKVVAKERVFKR